MVTKKTVRHNEQGEDEVKTRHQPAVNNSLKIKLDHLKTFEPLTENQRLFFEMYKGGAYFMGLFGSPGVGKTFLALYKSLEEVLAKDNSFKQVVVVRSLVQLREVGHLPGNLEEKQEIYELPYKEICSTLFGRSDAWDRLKEQGHARFISTTAIRGISIDDAIIIVDENQNLNWSEVNTIITRVGHRSKIIFSGDFKQTDLIKSNKDQTAFHDFLEVARNMKHFQEIYFTPDDIVRSSLVKDWIISCEKLGY
jgi:phosphate starvation-inducible PhoH-like protein